MTRLNPKYHTVTELGAASLHGTKQAESDNIRVGLYLRRHAQCMINKGSWLNDNQFNLLFAIESLVRELDHATKDCPIDESSSFRIRRQQYAINKLRELAQNLTIQSDDFWPGDNQYSGDLYVEHPQMSHNFVRVTESLDELPCEYLSEGYLPIENPADPDDPRNYQTKL